MTRGVGLNWINIMSSNGLFHYQCCVSGPVMKLVNYLACQVVFVFISFICVSEIHNEEPQNM
jgi:hypothetical protein